MKSFEGLQTDVAFLLAERFGDKAEAVYGDFAHNNPPLDESGVRLTDEECAIMDTIREAVELDQKARETLRTAYYMLGGK